MVGLAEFTRPITCGRGRRTLNVRGEYYISVPSSTVVNTRANQLKNRLNPVAGRAMSAAKIPFPGRRPLFERTHRSLLLGSAACS